MNLIEEMGSEDLDTSLLTRGGHKVGHAINMYMCLEVCLKTSCLSPYPHPLLTVPEMDEEEVGSEEDPATSLTQTRYGRAGRVARGVCVCVTKFHVRHPLTCPLHIYTVQTRKGDGEGPKGEPETSSSPTLPRLRRGREARGGWVWVWVCMYVCVCGCARVCVCACVCMCVCG